MVLYPRPPPLLLSYMDRSLFIFSFHIYIIFFFGTSLSCRAWSARGRCMRVFHKFFCRSLFIYTQVSFHILFSYIHRSLFIFSFSRGRCMRVFAHNICASQIFVIFVRHKYLWRTNMIMRVFYNYSCASFTNTFNFRFVFHNYLCASFTIIYARLSQLYLYMSFTNIHARLLQLCMRVFHKYIHTRLSQIFMRVFHNYLRASFTIIFIHVFHKCLCASFIIIYVRLPQMFLRVVHKYLRASFTNIYARFPQIIIRVLHKHSYASFTNISCFWGACASFSICT